jgi:hypothetical protein
MSDKAVKWILIAVGVIIGLRVLAAVLILRQQNQDNSAFGY